MSESSTFGPSQLRFRVLTDSQIQAIHFSALRVLKQVGLEVDSQDALELLREAGAEVIGTRARIPGYLVEEAIQAVPKTITLYTRDGQPAMNLEGREFFFGAYGGADHFYDPETGLRRPTSLQDIANIAIVCDYLPHIDWVMVAASGAPAEFHSALVNCRKPLYCPPHNLEDLSDILEMCSVVAGGIEQLRKHPFYVRAINSSSPLVYSGPAAQALLFLAERGLPIIFNAALLAGGSGPATPAGTLVVGIAEGLFGLVLSQLKRKGTPVIMGGVASIMDMVTGISSYGAPELSLMMSAYTDVIHSYGIPVYGTAGCSDSKLPDEQAAIEATFSILCGALSGANLIHDVGVVDIGMTVSLEAFVMSNEIIGMAKRIMGGMSVTPETLAFDVIENVGPGGHFLDHAHTLQHFREHWRSKLIDRQRYDKWLASGALSMRDRVKAKVRHILDEHKPAPLPEHILAELAKIVRHSQERAARS